MPDITIRKVNDTFIKVTCAETYMEMDLSDEFMFLVKNSQYDIRVKKGKWDGYKRLYNRRSKTLYAGLLLPLLELCNKRNWTFDLDPQLFPKSEMLEDEDLNELIEFINPHDNGQPLVPYDYQRECVKYMMNMSRTVSLAATSAGKSLIIYLAIRIYRLLDDLKDKRIILVVPSKSLVEQMYSDFENYSTFEGSDWKVQRYVQKIDGDYSKTITHPIVITTWQSFCKMPKWVYEDVGVIMVDEVHGASAAELSNILESCTSTTERHGLTATMSGFESDEKLIQGLLGPIKKFVSAKELIDAKRATPIEVHISMIDYPEEKVLELHNKVKNLKGTAKYHAELEFLYEMPERNYFIKQFIKNVPGNSLILFDRVDSYGKIMYEEFKKEHENTFLIIGEVSSTERELIRNSMEQYNDAKIFATLGTMKQGVSIKKIHNAFFISSSKSKITVLQSLGRLMRLHNTKIKAYIFDIVDNLTYKGRGNYIMRQAKERVKFYTQEGHPIKFERYKLFKLPKE